MRTPVAKLWATLRGSYWFVPGIMLVSALALAVATRALDASVPPDSRPWPLLPQDVDGARDLLALVAATTMSVAGVSFSVMVVALSMAVSQMGFRIRSRFMRDAGNHVVLGLFIATFAFSVAVYPDEARGAASAIPRFTLLGAIVLSFASLGAWIFFIHHAAMLLGAGHFAAAIGRDFVREAEKLLPAERVREPPASSVPDARSAAGVAAAAAGYLQFVNGEALVEEAVRKDVVVLLRCRTGDFLVPGRRVADVVPGERVDEPLIRRIRSSLLLGGDRTFEQDLEFPIDQLVQIGLRGLSPSVNDPIMAMLAIDWLGAGLCRIAERELPPSRRADREGRLRLVLQPITHDDLVDTALTGLRLAARGHTTVLVRLLRMIEAVAERAMLDGMPAALMRHARRIVEDARGCEKEDDRRPIEAAFAAASAVLTRSRSHGGEDGRDAT